MISKLWRGEVRLVIVYWVYGALVGAIYRILDRIIEHNLIYIFSSTIGIIAFWIFVIFPYIYFPFIYVAIWKSANNYTKSKGWASLAKIGVVIGAFSLVISAITIASDLSSNKNYNKTSSDTLKALEISLNEGLPKILDSETELTRISLENNLIVYHYRLIHLQTQDLDTKAFYETQRPILVNGVCNNAGLRRNLNQGSKMSYEYVDKNGTPIESILITSNDCTNK